ncbi:MAG: hypothetical protein ABH879_08235 [archaeon]
MGKLGSLDLSINAIVVLILAITMLGLGLGFMRDTFSSTTEQFDEVSENMRAQLIEELKQTNSRIEFNKADMEIKRGEKRSVFFAIRNDLNGDYVFDLIHKDGAVPPAELGVIEADGTWGSKTVATLGQGKYSVIKCYSTMDTTAVPAAIQMGTFSNRKIVQNGVDVLKLDISVPSNAKSTTYSCSMVIACPQSVDAVAGTRKSFTDTGGEVDHLTANAVNPKPVAGCTDAACGGGGDFSKCAPYARKNFFITVP